jgi:hypothetical protein
MSESKVSNSSLKPNSLTIISEISSMTHSESFLWNTLILMP